MAYRTDSDSQGRQLAPGQIVAYNMSGNVVPGLIERVTPTTVYIRPTGTLHYGRSQQLSKVKNGTSILVLT